MPLTAQDRRDRYARQSGTSPDPGAWAGQPAQDTEDDGNTIRTARAIRPAGTSAQRRRITHKARHASPTGQGLARRARAAEVAETRVTRRAETAELMRMLIGRKPPGRT